VGKKKTIFIDMSVLENNFHENGSRRKLQMIVTPFISL